MRRKKIHFSVHFVRAEVRTFVGFLEESPRVLGEVPRGKSWTNFLLFASCIASKILRENFMTRIFWRILETKKLDQIYKKYKNNLQVILKKKTIPQFQCEFEEEWEKQILKKICRRVFVEHLDNAFFNCSNPCV